LRLFLVDRPVPVLSFTPKELRARLGKTVEVLRHNIEIAEESNSKAIRVFTLVTIVFLPLSFIASVFGMNTTDIRDMGSSQRLFWAIAIPVTALIGCISLMVAYYGTRIWDELRKTPLVAYLLGRWLLGANVTITITSRSRSRRKSVKDEEKGGNSEVAETLLARSRMRRRRTTGLNIGDLEKKKKVEKPRPNRPNTSLGDMFFR
jgi:hypothetical protein